MLSIRAAVRFALFAGLTLLATLFARVALTSSLDHADPSRGRVKIEVVYPLPQLYPGAVTSLHLRLKNSSTHSVSVRAITPNGPVSSNDPACSDLRDDPATRTGVAVVRRTFAEPKIIPASSKIIVFLRDALMMNNSSVDGCQGVTYRIPLAAVTTPL